MDSLQQIRSVMSVERRVRAIVVHCCLFILHIFEFLTSFPISLEPNSWGFPFNQTLEYRSAEQQFCTIASSSAALQSPQSNHVP
jgi:hypothetical protein